ncbi:MAG: hypothetical protein ACAI43_19340, partial [Phycisphaerae bacterium]
EYRLAAEREGELGRAAFYADKAAQMRPQSARPMLMKAMVLAESGKSDAAARLAETAASAEDANDPRSVRLIAKFRRAQVARMHRTAAALRTPTVSSSFYDDHRSDGVWRVTRTTTYQPSGADLARAAALEAEARRMIDATRSTMEAAIKVSAGSLDGRLLEASYEDWFGTKARAVELLRVAVNENPDDLRAHDALVEYLRAGGRRADALEAEAAATRLVHTSCAPLLTKAWLTVDEQGFGPLVELLARARKLDPTDARATAYAAQAERDLRDKPKAAALYTVAAALETARLASDDRGDARAWPRRADDLATLMASRNLLAKAAKSFNQPDQEVAQYEATIALVGRFGPDARKTPMYGAVFLSQGANRVPVPRTPDGADVAAEAALAAGFWYSDRGRPADAERCWTLSKSLGHHPRNDPFPGRMPPSQTLRPPPGRRGD